MVAIPIKLPSKHCRNLKKICRNKIIKIEDVLDSPFLRWDWDELTLNENMTFDIIKN